MPKISIITPAYNCEKYLPDAVKSVLSQTFTDWELLIIDDCSKDNTYRYMKKLAEKDKRIRIFQNKVNSGSAATRNYGVRLARGEWIPDVEQLYLAAAYPRYGATYRGAATGTADAAYGTQADRETDT